MGSFPGIGVSPGMGSSIGVGTGARCIRYLAVALNNGARGVGGVCIGFLSKSLSDVARCVLLFAYLITDYPANGCAANSAEAAAVGQDSTADCTHACADRSIAPAWRHVATGAHADHYAKTKRGRR